MFDLEQKITEWRRRMLASGIESDGVLDELELHLREDIGRQIKSGSSVEKAFGIAMQNLGKVEAITAEFRKAGRASSAMEKLRIGICGVFLGFIVFLSVAAIILCFTSWQERVMASVAVACILLVACLWRYAVPFLPVIASTRRRWVIGLACIGNGFLASSFFCEVVLPHFEIKADQQRFEIALWAVFLIAVFACAGVGLLMSEREREVRGMTKHRSTRSN